MAIVITILISAILSAALPFLDDINHYRADSAVCGKLHDSGNGYELVQQRIRYIFLVRDIGDSIEIS